MYSRRTASKLTQEQAAEILGVSVRTVRRWEDRFEVDGAEGLYDRRLGKLANNRVATDKVMEMLELFETKYWDYTKALPREAGGPPWFHTELQLGAAYATAPRTGPAGPPPCHVSPRPPALPGVGHRPR